jgi:isoleucyl-tRNA synthetase
VGRLCTEAQRFIDVLSTWYVRRSRRRFYDEGWPADKRAAYSTLYEVLTTFNRVIAPIAPFMAEKVYQNLVVAQVEESPASVHHVPFPIVQAELIDESLNTLVAASIRLVSLGRSARKDSKLKVRQPLAEFRVVPADDTERAAIAQLGEHIVEELNVKSVSVAKSALDVMSVKIEPNMKTLGPKMGRHTAAAKAAIEGLDGAEVAQRIANREQVLVTIDGNLTPIEADDLIVKRTFTEGWAGAADGKTVVLLDTNVTEELKNEGIARDIIRNVQNLRKDAGLDIADRIRLSPMTTSPELARAIQQCRAYIAAETLAVEIRTEPMDRPLISGEVDIDGDKIAITLAKV